MQTFLTCCPGFIFKGFLCSDRSWTSRALWLFAHWECHKGLWRDDPAPELWSRKALTIFPESDAKSPEPGCSAQQGYSTQLTFHKAGAALAEFSPDTENILDSFFGRFVSNFKLVSCQLSCCDIYKMFFYSLKQFLISLLLILSCIAINVFWSTFIFNLVLFLLSSFGLFLFVFYLSSGWLCQYTQKIELKDLIQIL